jgi:hypothetical protein
VDGHQSLIPALELPDPDDRHVLATAIQYRTDLILTFNLDDFPEHTLTIHGIGACHPDLFLVDQLNRDAERVCLAMRQHRASLRNPTKTVEEYLVSQARFLAGSAADCRKKALPVEASGACHWESRTKASSRSSPS